MAGTTRRLTSHERQAGQPWDASYQDGLAPWDLGAPQPAIARLAASGAFTVDWRGTPLEVLDAGCGTGEHALLLAGLGVKVLGVDVAETALGSAREKARQRGLEVEFLSADALQLNQLRRTFDSVLDCGLFHSLDGGERRVYLASLASIIRPGGRVFVLCFSDVGAALGPHPVGEAELRAAFGGGAWTIESLKPEEIQTRFHDGGLPAWLATAQRN